MIHRGDTGPDVRIVRRKLGLDPDLAHDDLSVARIKGLARQRGEYEHHGQVDAEVAGWLGEAEAALAGLLPDWFVLRVGDSGHAVRAAAKLLGLETDRLDGEMESAIRRLQSASRLEPTGILDAETARVLGDL